MNGWHENPVSTKSGEDSACVAALRAFYSAAQRER
jgi:hypothetical protein